MPATNPMQLWCQAANCPRHSVVVRFCCYCLRLFKSLIKDMYLTIHVRCITDHILVCHSVYKVLQTGLCPVQLEGLAMRWQTILCVHLDWSAICCRTIYYVLNFCTKCCFDKGQVRSVRSHSALCQTCWGCQSLQAQCIAIPCGFSWGTTWPTCHGGLFNDAYKNLVTNGRPHLNPPFNEHTDLDNDHRSCALWKVYYFSSKIPLVWLAYVICGWHHFKFQKLNSIIPSSARTARYHSITASPPCTDYLTNLSIGFFAPPTVLWMSHYCY